MLGKKLMRWSCLVPSIPARSCGFGALMVTGKLFLLVCQLPLLVSAWFMSLLAWRSKVLNKPALRRILECLSQGIHGHEPRKKWILSWGLLRKDSWFPTALGQMWKNLGDRRTGRCFLANLMCNFESFLSVLLFPLCKRWRHRKESWGEFLWYLRFKEVVYLAYPRVSWNFLESRLLHWLLMVLVPLFVQWLPLLFLELGCYYISLIGLELTAVLLPQSLKC